MKILFLRARKGIPDSRVEKEIYSLSKSHDIELLCWDRELNCRKIVKKNIKIKDKTFKFNYICIQAPIGEGFKKMFFPLIHFWCKVFVYIFMHKNEYDVIHACDFDTAFPLLFIHHLPTVVYDIFDYYADTHKSPKIIEKTIRKFENIIIRKSNAVIICSEERKMQIYPEQPQNLIVIHNSPSFDNIAETALEVRKNVTRCSIAYVGSLSEERFLKEIADVIISRNDVELHIGGIGVLEKYFLELSKKYDNIIYYGHMEYKDVLSLESQCDLMTAIYDPSMPNHKYAAPNKFYESLMLKKPVIMMKNTGMDKFVSEYDLGYVINGGKETFKENFSSALNSLLTRKNEWADMGKRGYELYNNMFSWNEMEKRLLKLYEELPCK